MDQHAETTFLNILASNPDLKSFLMEFRASGVCYRCIFMIFRLSAKSVDLKLYRCQDFSKLDEHFGSSKFNLCNVCQGVLQNCDKDEVIDKIITGVKEQDFEYLDFKLTFGISIIAHMNKNRVIFNAEDKLGKKLQTYEEKNNSLEFKEVFKWIVSPIVASRLDKHPNLEGQFLINCNFASKDSENLPLFENLIVTKLQLDLTTYGLNNQNNKRKQKWQEKKQKKDGIKDPVDPMPKQLVDLEDNDIEIPKNLLSVEEIMKKMMVMPRPLFKDLNIFSSEIAKIDLTQVLTISCQHENVLVYGRYTKLSRKISQTPWTVDDNTAATSVQCEIAKAIKEHFLPAQDEFYLHAAGREDIDVRMLGTGRPFVFEFVNPRRAISCHKVIDLLKVQSEFVRCPDLKIVDMKFFDHLKEVENQKAKRYAAVVWLNRDIKDDDIEKLNSLENLKLSQQTPIRVLHRRSQMIRDKEIYKLKAIKIKRNYMILHLLASAGTYIKEFVHSDLGRTVPSIGSILDCEADILQLDVCQVYDSVEQVDIHDPKLFEVEIIK